MWFTETEDGERSVGVLGWIGVFGCFIMFLPLGVFVLIYAICWKCGSHASRYRHEKFMEKQRHERMVRNEEYLKYKSQRDDSR